MKKLLLLILMIVSIVIGATIVVDPLGGGDYTLLNDAMDNSSAGDTIKIHADTLQMNSYQYIKRRHLHIFGDPLTIPKTVLNMGDCPGFILDADNYVCDSAEISNFVFRRTVTLSDGSYAMISTLGPIGGGFNIHDCVFDANGVVTPGFAANLRCSNYSTVNHDPIMFKRCLLNGVGVGGSSFKTGSPRNVYFDSCLSVGSGISVYQKWHVSNSLFLDGGETQVRGDSSSYYNCHFKNFSGEVIATATMADDGYHIDNNMYRKIYFDSCVHVPLMLDGSFNTIIDSVYMTSRNDGNTSTMYQHNRTNYDSIYNLKVSNITVINNHIALFLHKIKHLVIDKIFNPTTSQKYISLQSRLATEDTVKNSVASYIYSQIDSIGDTSNLRTSFSWNWMLDTIYFGFVKLKYIDSAYGNSWRGAIIDNIDTNYSNDTMAVTFNISTEFKHHNSVVLDSFWIKNTYWSGDTAECKLIYKQHSSSTWLNSFIDTGAASQSLNLKVSNLSPSTEYDIAVVVQGLSSGTTNLSDTTKTYTFTTPASGQSVTITTQPKNDSVYTGEYARFFVTATGNDLTYQWYKNGQLIQNANNDTLIFLTSSADSNSTYYCSVSGTNSNTVDLILLGTRPFLFPTVKTWSYCLHSANNFASNDSSEAANERMAKEYQDSLSKMFDMIVIDHGKEMQDTFRRAQRVLTYTLATNLTVYNRDLDTYVNDIDSLKKWIEREYVGQNTDSILEECFVHLVDTTFTMTFSQGGSMIIYPYDPQNPKLSRLPGSWQKNSDWGMNICNPVYKRYWREKLIPYYMQYTPDGIFNDVQMWFSNIRPETGKIREYPNGQIWSDSLKSMTKFCRDAIHDYNPNAKFIINNYEFESDTTYKLYKYADYCLHEVAINYAISIEGLKGELDGAIKTQDSSGGVTLLHGKSFQEYNPSDTTLKSRDEVAGLCFYLLSNKSNAYYFSYAGGTIYGNDMRKYSFYELQKFDFGVPTQSSYSFVKVKDPEVTNCSGRCSTEVWSRNYSNCKVYLKTRSPESISFGDNTITKHFVNGTYALLGSDGLPIDTITDTLSLRNWEGAILVPLSLESAPVITLQPHDTTVVENTTATFTTSATGATNYQWWVNDIPVNGATSPTYSFTATSGMNGYSIYCAIWNDYGFVHTDTITLTVTATPPAAITTQPQNANVTAGQTATFTIAGTSINKYQWYGNNTLIPGATGSSYSFITTIELDGSTIYCVVNDTLSSDTVTLTVNLAIVIQQAADTFKLRVSTLNDTGKQWYQDNIPIAGATDSVLAVIADSAFYASKHVIYCMVTNASSSVKSGEWWFNVSTPSGSRWNGYRSTDNYTSFKRAWK